MNARAFRNKVNVCLAAVLALNIALWAGSRSMYAEWAGVPPVPTRAGATVMTLGDAEMAFRTGAMTLQTMGDGGGRTTPLNDYDYTALGRWFSLLNALNPASEHVPALASYYFGAVRKPESIAVVVAYLASIGQNPAGEKWRWLPQAAYLAQHRLKDMDLALDISYTLSRMRPLNGPLPSWAREFPAFVLEARGEKEASRAILEAVLRTEKNLPPQEVNFMVSMLRERLGVPEAEIQTLLQSRESP